MQHYMPNLRLVTTDGEANVSPPAPTPFILDATSLRPRPRRPITGRRPLGQVLLDMTAVDPGNLLKALALRDRQDLRLGEILLGRGWVSEADLLAALSTQWRCRIVDVLAAPPDPRLVDRIGGATCLRRGIVPWRRIGNATVIVTSRPEDFALISHELPTGFGEIVMALAPERDIHAAIVNLRQTALIRRAETRVPAHESCRGLGAPAGGHLVLLLTALLALGSAAAPRVALAVVFGWAFVSLVCCTGLKLAAFVAEAGARRRPVPRTVPAPLGKLPVVSVLVPLFHERDIAPRLIKRIGRIDYPKELLDIVLVIEEIDMATQEVLAAARLPRWMRVVVVPDGPIRTKPRALNYALDYCRGSIVGVWDAEDAPEPAQIRKIVRRFASSGPDVACLQGILDYYDARKNWLSRCFTIEYAAWFRAMLPGLARLGLVVPLGGTTVFFRRGALEALGGWDAHNVTEDADLGLRLARHGYRTELVDTVTEEEPNARALPWIRQRSRWLKGYAMTWAVHMRDPARLWRELGPKRFLGVQILFFGTLSQYLLAPFLWSFWLLAFGFGHPVAEVLPQGTTLVLAGIFVLSEIVNITVGLWAVRGPGHRHLMKWVVTLHFYFPLGAVASYKAFYEALVRPFYWDKTCHGASAAPEAPDAAPPLLVQPVPIAPRLAAYLLINPLLVPPRRPAEPFVPRRLHLSLPALERAARQA